MVSLLDSVFQRNGTRQIAEIPLNPPLPKGEVSKESGQGLGMAVVDGTHVDGSNNEDF